jgi:hypothetical protein
MRASTIDASVALNSGQDNSFLDRPQRWRDALAQSGGRVQIQSAAISFKTAILNDGNLSG